MEHLISVIIPTLNEESNLRAVLHDLVRLENIETIVVDGGSSDGTCAVEASCGVKLIETARGRAIQMNEGARAAKGDILLFLHADTRLPHNWARMVRDELTKAGTAAGAFELAIDGNMRGLRIIERMANLRARWLQLPYGDQAIFLNAALFRRFGGFSDLPIMEDFEFIRRLRVHGRIRTVPGRATTSARRWQDLGVWRTTLINQTLIIGYLMGISPKFMARVYYGHYPATCKDRKKGPERTVSCEP